MPVTEEQTARWIPKDGRPVQFPAPVLEPWDPPTWVPRRATDKGIWLAQNAVCFQRGYAPLCLYQNYIDACARCFRGKHEDMESSLQYVAFDFFVAIVTTASPHETERVAAGCVVELRPAVNPTQAACLYISTLCTHPNYGGKGLAHQLMHAVYTLGMLLLEQNNRDAARGAWRHAIPSQKLFVALNVRHEADTPSMHERLIRMYSQCGLTTKERVPHVQIRSFTPFSIYNWQYDSDPEELIPMWQDVSVAVLYEDDQVRIMRPSEEEKDIKQDRPTFYHAFPEKHLAAVQSRGIVHAKHAFLLPTTEAIYTAQEISFSRVPPPSGACFCIQAERKTPDGGVDIRLRISVPSWFALRIESVSIL